MSATYLDSGKFYSKVQILTAMMSLIRNIVIARVLAVEDYGIAATIGIVLSFIEMSTMLAFDKYLLKSRYGNNERVVGVTHSLGIIRGIIVALFLFVIAEPVSYYFRIPEKAWMFEVLALAPLIRGFLHQNAVVHQKKGSFYRLSQIELIPQLVTTLTIYPASLHFADAAVVLYVVILTSAGSVLVSHFLATLPFKLYFKKAILADILQYSWPLLVTGGLMFLVFQGDKAIVGGYYSLEDLALITVLISLFSMPVMVFARISMGIGMPLVAKELSARSGSDSRDLVICVVIIVACMAVAGFNSLGHIVIGFLYGDDYVPEQGMIYIISVLMGLRILRMPVQVFSLAAGDSKNGMYVGIARASSLLPSFYFAVNGYEIIVILAMGIAGELLGLVVGTLLAKSVAPRSWNTVIVMFSLFWLMVVSLFSYWVTDRYGINPIAGFIMQFIFLFTPFFLIFRSKFTMEFIHRLKRV
jgi:O-antigen/teichoic acid export membrane protein